MERNLAYRICAICLAFILSCNLLAGCSNNPLPGNDEVEAFAILYLEALKNGVEEAVQYCVFRDDTIRSAYINSKNYITDYSIKNIKKLNDQLYEILVEVEDPFQEERYTVYNFVVIQDGKLLYANGVRNIPEAVKEGVDLSAYSYGDPNIIDEGAQKIRKYIRMVFLTRFVWHNRIS